MFSIVSIIFWTAFFMQVAMASPGGEGDYTPSLRYPEKPDPLPTVYNVDTAQAGANDDQSPIVPRAVVNTRPPSAAATSNSAADGSLGHRVDGLTTVVVAGSLIWTFAM